MNHPAARLALAIADQLASPAALGDMLTAQPWRAQSLSLGAPAVALLHIELAASGLRPWQRAHDWLRCATSGEITSGFDSHLFHGAPAIAHTLSCAAVVRPGAYERVLTRLNETVTADARRRVEIAHARIDARRPARLAEFDIIRGLTGVGSHLLRHDPDGRTIRTVLEYLVRLTEPVTADGELLPGWWTPDGPSGRAEQRMPGGHANAGLAHGVAGPLALLSLAALEGVVVDNQRDAIGRIVGWYDRIRAHTATGHTIWPYWASRSELRTGPARLPEQQRPSWCYGTAGVARALQLAARATGDPGRALQAETALVHALTDPRQRDAISDPALCHGYAGIAHVATRIAADAAPASTARLGTLVAKLLDAVLPSDSTPDARAASLLHSGAGPGLLDGAAGVALACLAASGMTPRSGWDTCLLITAATNARGEDA
ncbi:lanthionine synthetase C family protein [Catellatospora coxensis]|uniref:Lanthionine synthetase-like protein n=1 Tax=Catellatospora coxensis TaxID=310354 RepID=A0A8J3L575_9ACTN|nr:lanthionine synthetase C family protein [Catellatospora coxensis]GIG08050.1 hypothetical protein Cco03nite_47500 [Catellatospora coxensis]